MESTGGEEVEAVGVDDSSKKLRGRREKVVCVGQVLKSERLE